MAGQNEDLRSKRMEIQYMNSRSTKIIVDILMTVFLILSFIRWEGDATFHIIVGSACSLFFAVHVLIHRKWLKAVTKSCMAGKLNKKHKGKYVVNILLLIIWSVAIITGFLAIGYFVGGVERMAIFSRIHGISSRVGLVLIVVHAVQHWVQIKSYFGRRKAQKSESDV